ncbi:MAG: alpha-1,2-fucosyltransferase [Gallionella sp.]|nr:alpha-1,2-fucosyltransferase [Gallionella sp.]
MILFHIIGGLGNQMFQYAAGRALALERGQSLKLDIAGFVGYGLHQGFELQRVFNIPAEIATETEVRNILGWQIAPGIRRMMARPGMAAFRRRGFVVEPCFHYWSEIKKVPENCYLAGYWQSEKYFQEVASVIRSDFTFKSPLLNKNAECAKQINQVNAVSLHVRRGDYANNPKTAATHGLCSLDYYRAAIQHVSEQAQNPHFFVFSDDIAWVKNNLKIDYPHQYVEHNYGEESYNDMRLMSMCKHHIIANSSFSWWGAWLNPRADKIVVAPKRWFASQTDVRDLLPQGWVRL